MRNNPPSPKEMFLSLRSTNQATDPPPTSMKLVQLIRYRIFIFTG